MIRNTTSQGNIIKALDCITLSYINLQENAAKGLFCYDIKFQGQLDK